MIDGPTEIRDRDLTEANNTLVKSFLTDILMNRKDGQAGGIF